MHIRNRCTHIFWIKEALFFLRAIHRVDTKALKKLLLASAFEAHNHEREKKITHTLVTIHLKTRTPPMCSWEDCLSHLCHCCEAATTKSCESSLWRIAHVRSQGITRKMTCKGEECFSFSKTKSLLHNQSDQQMATAPNRTKGFKVLLNHPNQMPNMWHIWISILQFYGISDESLTYGYANFPRRR